MANHPRSTEPIWSFVSAVVWVATRDVTLADSLARKRGCQGRWSVVAQRAIGDRLSDPSAALVTSFHELLDALTTARLRARSAADGRTTAIAAETWALPINQDGWIAGDVLVGAAIQRFWDPEMFPVVSPARRAAGAQARGGWRTSCVGGVVPLFKPADVMRVFPPPGADVKAAAVGRAQEPNMTERLTDIAKDRKRRRKSLIRVEAGGRTGVADEMRAILAELPPGMRPSPSLLKKVLRATHPTR